MSFNLPLLDLPFDSDTSVAYIVHLLTNRKLHVSRSFKLDSACGSLSTGICSHDPKSPCECQLVVLLVTDSGLEPVSIILHSYNDNTEIFLDDGEKITGQEINERITQALVYYK